MSISLHKQVKQWIDSFNRIDEKEDASSPKELQHCPYLYVTYKNTSLNPPCRKVGMSYGEKIDAKLQRYSTPVPQNWQLYAIVFIDPKAAFYEEDEDEFIDAISNNGKKQLSGKELVKSDNDTVNKGILQFINDFGHVVAVALGKNRLYSPDGFKALVNKKKTSTIKIDGDIAAILNEKSTCHEDYQMYYHWAHMLDEAFCKDQLLTEGKHWPEDYIKTGINLVKASPIGQQSWYSDAYIQQDIKTFADEFGPLSHKNSNLGFFSTIVKWFIAYSGTSKEKCQEFIERKLDGIIGTLQVILNDQSYDKVKDEIKQKWTFEQFEELQKKINDEAKASSDEKLKNINARDDYDLIPIYSYEELHEKFGGKWTGYKGESEWCHTNGKSTYESWTKNGTQMFFVLAKKDWQKIKPIDPKTTNAYDEYGLSLIAILIDVATGNLLNETLRWNHVIEPSATNPGTSVDKAFKNNWGALSQAIGMDVKAACEKEFSNLKQKLQKEADAANKQVAEILKGKIKIVEDTIPKALKSRLTKVDIPNGVKSIGNDAFSYCSSLSSITIPYSATSIGSYAFSYCYSLSSVTISDNMTSIEDGAFSFCHSLTSVAIPNGVTSIKSNTFTGCSRLTSVAIPDSVTNIGPYAFEYCTSLTNVTIPNSVTSIGGYAFSECKSLTSATIPNGVTRIKDATFYGCNRLTNVTIPNSVTSIGDQAFHDCNGLTSITIPDSVANIGDYAFQYCSGLQNVTIPNSVTSIGSFVFSGCSELTSVTIGNGVINIGRYAFVLCNGLTSVTIPSNVSSIGDSAFMNCNNLKQLVFKGKTIEEVKAMKKYPWGIKDESIIKCKSSLNESKATYLQKYRDEADAKKIVDAFWQIKSRLSAPQNDIDWWIKKPFADLKSFVLNYNHANKKQRRDADYRKQALENDAKLLDTIDGYEIWYVPTYEAMRILGRFYKGRSAKWCVASDDPDFWFDNHDEDEFVVLVREHPKNDRFDKVAIQMMNHGRYYNENDIIPWDLENEDRTFTDDSLIQYAWYLFKDNGEQREQYYEVD